MYFVATTMYNVPPAFVLECLDRVTRVIRDFCGVLSEELIRKNFTLVYEILNEMVDYGYPQLTSTELLRPFIVSEPIMLPFQQYADVKMGPAIGSRRTHSSRRSSRPTPSLRWPPAFRSSMPRRKRSTSTSSKS